MSDPDAWRPLASWKPKPFDAGVFDVVGKDARAAEDAIRAGLREVALAPWPRRAAHLAEHFGTAAPGSCFGSEPHRWANFLEPQITKGFAHFLMEGTRRRSLDRCLAFVRAAMACHGAMEQFGTSGILCAEAIAEEERVDLLVELEGPTGKFGAVIEAKFGHRLTDQLKKAEDHVLNVRSWDKAQSAFLVLGREPVPRTHVHLRADWHAASWWTFLRHLDAQMTEAADCTDYARFRRTVWCQAYKG